MLQTVTGIYDNGKIRLHEQFLHKRSRVIVTFLENEETFKTLSKMPSCFKKPLKVSSITNYSRDELHER